MKTAVFLLSLVLAAGIALAQQSAPSSPAPSSQDISGMYTFLREGEFVEIDVEDAGSVTGFISRYGDLESDRGAFLDHMFSKGSLEGDKLSFETKKVHGMSYEFRGKVVRGEAKTRDAEGYYVIKGTLIEKAENPDKTVTARQREVELKSFPGDAVGDSSKKKEEE